MPTSVLATTLPLQGCSTEQVARQWAVTFAELFRVSLKERGQRFVDLWVSALADLKPEVLDEACQLAMRVCKFFPTPAEIREHIDNANSAGLELEAEEAWEHWYAHVQKYFHPELGWDRRAPQLDAITEHAGRAAGGARWVAGCPESELPWARKRFIRSYTLAHETGQVQNLLTRGETKKIFASLTRNKPAKLPAVAGLDPSKPNDETLQSISEVLR